MLEVFRKFRMLSPEKKSMLALFWVYEFANTTINVFISVFVYFETGSLAFLGLFALMQFTGAFFGFAVFGFILARKRYSMKWNYLRSFAVYFCCFTALALAPHTKGFLLLYSFMYGLGLGIFWLGNHTYELIYTKNEEGDRDFYSSMVQGGTQLISIAGPLVGTLLVVLSERVFKIETFKILFGFLPFVYLFSLPFLFRLPHFIPPLISRKEIKSFLTTGSRKLNAYFFLYGAKELLGVSVAFFTIMVLRTVLNIGIWQVVVALVAFFTTVWLAKIRHEGNRFKIMSYALIGVLAAAGSLIFSDLSIYFFIFFSLVIVISKPVYRVSEHAIDLRVMDILAQGKSSFYPGILYRESVLFAGRFFFLALLIFASTAFNDDLLTAKVAIVVYMILILANWFIVRGIIRTSAAR